jgi:hypothetical protein
MRIKITRACGTPGGSWAVDQIVDETQMSRDIMYILIRLNKAEECAEPQREEVTEVKPKAKTTKKRGKK